MITGAMLLLYLLHVDVPLAHETRTGFLYVMRSSFDLFGAMKTFLYMGLQKL